MSQFLSSIPLTFWTEISAGIGALIFLVQIIWIYRPSGKQHYEGESALVLHDPNDRHLTSDGARR